MVNRNLEIPFPFVLLGTIGLFEALLVSDKTREQMQTCHSIELKNLDLTNKKLGSGGKNRDHGPIGYKKK